MRVAVNGFEPDSRMGAETIRAVRFSAKEADALTCSFARSEIERYLRETPAGLLRFDTLDLSIGSEDQRAYLGGANDPQACYIGPGERPGRLIVCGGSRAGLLHGVYTLLSRIGWVWPYPGHEAHMPEYAEIDSLSRGTVHRPSFRYRGFHPEPISHCTTEFLLWMARNRMNFYVLQPGFTDALKNLCFNLYAGTHILDEILGADEEGKSGRLFDEHPEWFALVGGERTPYVRHQMCLSNPELCRFLASKSADFFAQKCSDADIFAFWLSDSWDTWCECEDCRRMGSCTDRYVNLTHVLRGELDLRFERGELETNPELWFGAYEGGQSLSPPRRFPEGFAFDHCVLGFYPINRCYAHDFNDRECTELNRHYLEALEGWRSTDKLQISVCEYYGVSQYQDLPLVFRERMSNDVPFYKSLGVMGCSYMHSPVEFPGPRALNNFIFAGLLWDAASPSEKLCRQYLGARYGASAAAMRRFHDLLEKAFENITALQSWHQQSLSVMIRKICGSEPTETGGLLRLEHLSPGTFSLSECIDTLLLCRTILDEETRRSAACSQPLEEDRTLLEYGYNWFVVLNAIVRIDACDGDTEASRDALRGAAEALRRITLPCYSMYPDPFGSGSCLDKTMLKDIIATLLEGEPPDVISSPARDE